VTQSGICGVSAVKKVSWFEWVGTGEKEWHFEGFEGFIVMGLRVLWQCGNIR